MNNTKLKIRDILNDLYEIMAEYDASHDSELTRDEYWSVKAVTEDLERVIQETPKL